MRKVKDEKRLRRKENGKRKIGRLNKQKTIKSELWRKKMRTKEE